MVPKRSENSATKQGEKSEFKKSPKRKELLGLKVDYRSTGRSTGSPFWHIAVGLGRPAAEGKQLMVDRSVDR